VLTLGAIVILFALAIGGGALAGSVSPWLAIPGGLLGFGIGMAISEAPPLILGTIEGLFYSFVTYVFTDGFDRREQAPSLAYAAITATVFGMATFSAWREENRGKRAFWALAIEAFRRMRPAHRAVAGTLAVVLVLGVVVFLHKRADELAQGTSEHASDALASGNVNAAIEAARTATRQNGDATSFETYAAALAAGHRHKEAAKAYSEVIRLKPNDAAAYLGRAEARRAAGDLKDAIEDYRALVTLEPDSPLYRQLLADAERELAGRASR
jgi:tetratricopeptide (TPR) repeat protein